MKCNPTFRAGASYCKKVIPCQDPHIPDLGRDRLPDMKTLAGIRRSIPESCYEISPAMGWFTVMRILALLSISIYLETLTDNILYLIPLWFFHGQVLVGMFVLGHDCGHYTFAKNKTMNLIMGHLAFSPLGNGLASWTVTHNHHHASLSGISRRPG